MRRRAANPSTCRNGGNGSSASTNPATVFSGFSKDGGPAGAVSNPWAADNFWPDCIDTQAREFLPVFPTDYSSKQRYLDI